MKTAVKDYTAHKGEFFERLLILKDRRTHRRRVPTEADATILVDSVQYILPVEITSEGGVLFTLTPQNTEWLGVGEFAYDAVVTVSVSPLLTSTPLQQLLCVKGTITVSDEGNMTPLDSDDDPVALEARV